MARIISLRFRDTPEDQARAREIVEALRENTAHTNEKYIEARAAGYSAGLSDGVMDTQFLPCRCEICITAYTEAFSEGAEEAVEEGTDG